MDTALSNFWGWHTLVFGLACYILTQFTRRVVETRWPHLRKGADENSIQATYSTEMSRWWNQVILYALPVLYGAACAVLAFKYPFPEGMQSFSGRLFFGIVIGFFSGFLFKFVKRALAKKITGDPNAYDTVPSPPDDEA